MFKFGYNKNVGMKNLLNIKIWVLALVGVFGLFTVAAAQDASTSTPPQDFQPTIEQQIELRNAILDLFGIPHDVPLSIFDLVNGNTLGIRQPNAPLRDLELFLRPLGVRPGQEVNAVVVTFTADLQAATISWYHNGKLALSGKGKTTYSFTAGPLGSPDTIRVAVSAAGFSNEASKTIYPGLVHLTWFSDGYTPRWYRGKALPQTTSRVTVYAVPELLIGKSRFSPQELIYRWSIDGRGLDADSGRGKDTFILSTSYGSGTSYEVGVTVSDDQGRVASQNTITVPVYDPVLRFYEIDPLLGEKFSRALDSYDIKSGKAITVKLEPFFLPLREFPKLQYSWSVNDAAVGEAGASPTLRLSTNENSTGTQVVSVNLRNPSNPFRFGDATMRLNIFK